MSLQNEQHLNSDLLDDDTPTDLERIVNLKRRSFIGAGALCGAAFFLGGNLLSNNALAGPVSEAARWGSAGRPSRPLLGFKNVPASTADQVILPPGYEFRTLISWGEPLFSNVPDFKHDGTNTSEDQELQFGDNNDGMCFFPFYNKFGRIDPDRALIAINNEYTNYEYLFSDGRQPSSPDDVRKALAAEGVSVIEVRRRAGRWVFKRDSRYNRRVHGNVMMDIKGPAAGHDLLRTSIELSGKRARGTFQNCSSGQTPWGTYLTCEENFNGCFGSTDKSIKLNAAQKRYGLSANSDNNWYPYNERFDLAKHPNEANHFGWIVEIDPFNPDSTPVKRTALGRFKHENAAVTTTQDGRVVVYMGDDERGEFIYKFVSDRRYNPNTPLANRDILDHGTLYVAKFDDGDGDVNHPRGRGQWIELTYGKNGLTKANGFNSQAEILIHARLAGSQVGATRMDRPEWIAVSPINGQVFCTLTNNSKRGSADMPVNGPNPRANNIYGQILRWEEPNPAALTFDWDLFIVAGNPVVHPEDPYDGSENINADNMFNSPDGLGFDEAGRLWIQTDGEDSNEGDYAGMGNNQMLCADPNTGEIRRFLVGPTGCEVTGLSFAPDYRTMFVGFQHPTGGFPDYLPNGRPRSTVIAITRKDGGIIGE
ncbi:MULTISPECIES: PhoX family phosphatase [unclassified Pseudomonas]|uniref:PhoX family protein n=1 Tax=unclassified Pseudomonas TaxID=196821 RepID=UPI00257E41EE|nr:MULTISPECIES: PhoX family phosphatase [unclassified Pseudomonas]